jgi:hypothetical protein
VIFQTVSLLIAVPALLKAVTGLVLPGRFYGWRRQQYASASVPRVVLIMPALFLILAAASWYATLFHYQPWGWVVTGFTSLIASLGLLNLSRWSSHRQKTGEAIDNRPRTRAGVDLAILFLGLLFTYLALFVY